MGVHRAAAARVPRHSAELDRPHRRLHGAEGEHAHHQLPAALPPARQGDAGRSDPARRHQPDHQLRRQVQLQLDDQLHLRRRRGAGVPQGHGHPRERVVRQHQGEQVQSRSRPVGGLRRPHGRRDGARLDERGLPQRRRIQDSGAKRQGRGVVPVRPHRSAQVRRHATDALRRSVGVRCSAPRCAAVCALPSAQQLPSEPRRQFGTSVTGAFEGWFENADGSRTFLVGYLNRNSTQEIDVPDRPRTTASSRADPTWGSRRISCPAGSGACSR